MRLPIDMIDQFPVGDSLHLLHMGVMKRFLFGWRDGLFRKPKQKGTVGNPDDEEDRRRKITIARFSGQTINEISEYLNACKLPSEFTRVMKGLDDLTHWKATQYRAFLHYIGIVVLKGRLIDEAYQHFLLLFCAVTLCSSKEYFQHLQVARAMIDEFIEIYMEFYGVHYVTSNVHNLTHLVDEVEMFGELETFSAYPFENMLGKIKRMLRSGNRPLAQIAKRLMESSHMECGAGRHDHNIDEYISPSEKPPKVIVSQRNSGHNIPEDLKAILMASNKSINFFRM